MLNLKVMVETSARHLHLSQADLETLFGAGAELTVKKELSQPGQFALQRKKVEVVGPKGSSPEILQEPRDVSSLGRRAKWKFPAA